MGEGGRSSHFLIFTSIFHLISKNKGKILANVLFLYVKIFAVTKREGGIFLLSFIYFYLHKQRPNITRDHQLKKYRAEFLHVILLRITLGFGEGLKSKNNV